MAFAAGQNIPRITWSSVPVSAPFGGAGTASEATCACAPGPNHALTAHARSTLFSHFVPLHRGRSHRTMNMGLSSPGLFQSL
jgi:hypothetical protein